MSLTGEHKDDIWPDNYPGGRGGGGGEGPTSAVSARRSAHARRKSVLDGSAFFDEERPTELRPKSGREGRKLRSARVMAEIRAEDQVKDSEFYG